MNQPTGKKPVNLAQLRRVYIELVHATRKLTESEHDGFGKILDAKSSISLAKEIMVDILGKEDLPEIK